jgi:hypothetical protein
MTVPLLGLIVHGSESDPITMEAASAPDKKMATSTITRTFAMIAIGYWSGRLNSCASKLLSPAKQDSYCADSSSSSSDSRSREGNTSTSLIASRSALMPK